MDTDKLYLRDSLIYPPHFTGEKTGREVDHLVQGDKVSGTSGLEPLIANIPFYHVFHLAFRFFFL